MGEGGEIKQYAENVVEAPVAAENAQPLLEVELPEQKAQPLLIQLGKKGQAHKTAEFLYKPLGFDVDSQVKATACCRTSKSLVKVTKVDKGQQAETLAVEPGAIIYKVNGKEIADVPQFQDLISKHWLPEKAACH